MLQPGVLQGNALSAAYASRGVAYDNLGDIDRSLADFREAARIDPTNARAFKMLCIGTVAKKHDDNGMPYCDSAIRLDPASYEPFAISAEWKYRNNDCDGSIADNTAALRANAEGAKLLRTAKQRQDFTSDRASLFAVRGTCYGAKGDFDQAITDFSEAIRLNPDIVAALKGRGIAYEATRQSCLRPTISITSFSCSPWTRKRGTCRCANIALTSGKRAQRLQSVIAVAPDRGTNPRQPRFRPEGDSTSPSRTTRA